MLLQPPKVNRFGEISFKDIKRAWLNENTVRYYIDYSLRKLPSKKNYGVIDSSHVRFIMSSDCSHPPPSLLEAHIFDLDLLFIPINDKQKHWSLVVLFPEDCSIRYFDSCGRTNKSHIQKVKELVELSYFAAKGSKLSWNVHRCPWRKKQQLNGECKYKLPILLKESFRFSPLCCPLPNRTAFRTQLTIAPSLSASTPNISLGTKTLVWSTSISLITSSAD